MKHCNTYRGLKATLLAFFAIAFMAISIAPGGASAQNARIVHSIVKQVNHPPQMGRELWFTMILNYSAGGAGKYYALYVTSPAQTNVYVNMAGQATKVLPVQPYKVASFLIPNGWEVISSAIVTNQAMHVWSKDGDICAYLMSHNPYTSDGMYIIPTIGWGVDYVVAAYNALFEGGGGYVYDYPSEFAIISNQDNTTVTITPSCDIRIEGSPQACCSCLIHQKGVPFIETLNRGQAIQYQSTCTQNTEDYDFTGTVVHSNNPVGVVGGSACPNIPMEDPYCDHVCDMMAPIRTWANTYYSAPFYPAGPGKQWSSFLVISSKANQTIYRTDPVVGKTQYCQISQQYGTYLRPDIDQPSKWESDAPFSLVQYINSSTYPDGVNGNGDPAEVIINPLEQYTKTVVFQTPTSQGSQSPYINYVNIITNKAVTATTTFDGQKLSGQPHMQIDGKYEITRMKAIPAGAHLVVSDSGVGVYIYGYGFDESYAWTGSFGTGTFNSPDTVAPAAKPSGSCFYAHVGVSDTGLFQSKLNYIRLDSVYNMAYNHDDPTWIEGVGRFSSFYDMFVLDSTKEAILVVSVFDFAGNQTTITSTYKPQIARIAPPVRDFGIGNILGAPVFEYDTIVNTGKVQFKFDNLKLVLGKGISGFNLDSAVLTPLAVGETRVIKISFVPKDPKTAYDTIVFGDECIQQQVLVLGTGGGADFRISNYNYGTLIVATPGNTPNPKTALSPSPVTKASITSTHIVNLSKSSPVTINRIWADSMSEFTLKDAFVSLTLPPLGDTTVSIRFTPQYLGTVSSAWHASSDDKDAGGLALGRRNAKLTGAAAMPGQEFFRDTTITVSCPTASDALILISDTLFATGTSATVINHLGHTAKPDPNGWSNFTAYYDNRIVNPDTIVVTLENKGALVVTENFRPPLNVNGSYSDTIIATTPNGDTLRVRATVNVVSRGGSVSDTAIDFGTVPFKSAPVSKTFTITDTMSTPLLVRPMTQTGRYKSAYTYTSNPAVPVTLQPGKSVTFTVTFDPSVSFDSMQTAFIQPDMNSCQLPYAIPVQAQVSVRDAETQGYKSSKILACNTQSGPVTVFNNIKNQGALTIDDTVISVTLTGTNASSWTLDTVKGVVGTIIRGGGGSLVIPTTYHPSGSQIQNATAYVVVRVRNSRRDKASSGDTTMTQIITGSAEGLNVLASSKVAIAEPADEKGDQNLQIPIDITVSGFADSLKTVNITTVRLTYLFNVDLLDMKNGLGSAFQGLSGWTLDPNNSKVIMDSRRPGTTNMRFVDTVILTLTNATPLDNATPSLGTINFRMTLPSQDSTSDISIHSIELLQSSGAAVTGCVGTDTLGGTLAIVHHCGNEILTAFMNGNTALLGITTPATPDPVHGGTIAISYVNRGESNLTLTMYDMLGNEVARPLDAVHHAAGSWQVNCNVSKLSSGTYTYRLTDGHAMISKQFVIQR